MGFAAVLFSGRTCAVSRSALDRRWTRRTSAAAKQCVLLALIVLIIFTIPPVHAADRITLNFNPDWKFIKADPAGAEAPAFNDSSWGTVSTPHTYNDVDSFSALSPGRMRGETNLWAGRTWYRKTFTLPEAMRGKEVFVEFEAVRQVAEVYLNGQKLGVCKNGFIPFGFNLTPYVKFGEPNVLAVMCDNRYMVSNVIEDDSTAPTTKPKGKKHSSTGQPAPKTLGEYSKRVNATIPADVDKIQANQIPWNNPQWHPPLGGIYRNVRLYVTDPLHISLPLYDFLQTEGPYVHADSISEDAAQISGEVPIENNRATAARVTVEIRVIDRDGRTVVLSIQPRTIEAGGKTVVKFTGTIANPQLWEPDFPYLYRVVCAIKSGNETIDSCEVPLGIRAVHWDIATGFWINGHHLKLHGWGQRPTDEWPGIGSAQPDWLHFYTLELMKEAGGNFVRWGHSAGGADMIHAADELGLVTDQPGVDGESDTVGAAWKIRAEAFRDCLIYFRNDPSILIWEGGNQKVSKAHAEELRGIKDKYDPSGGRALAFRRADKTTAEFMDISIGTEGSHEAPRLPVVEGEYDREESPRRVWDDFSPPDFGYPQARGQTFDLTSEQYAVNQVDQYVRKISSPSACGGGNWIFSDSTSGGRDTAEVDRASGEVDGVRLPKEAYYVCQALFRSDPQVHIIGHWTYPAGTKKTVYVVSNCAEVELFLNGRSLGPGKKSEEYLFTFPDVSWSAGQLKAVAYNNNSPAASETLQTAGPAVALRMKTISGPGGLQANGSDVALIDVDAVDANGERCPTFQQRVDFTCTGPAIWRGGYNSGIANSVNKAYLNLECGVNRVAVRSTLKSGAITVTANCAGLKPARVTIPSHSWAVTNGFSSLPPAMPGVALARSHADWSGLAKTIPPMTVTAATTGGLAVGQFTQAFAYSGSNQLVHIETGAADGKNIYCDQDQAFANLPGELTSADWVQSAYSDRGYSAADLMQIEVKAGSTVYVAHDDKLSEPAWLTDQFKPTDLRLAVNGRAMKIFQHLAPNEESLTLGSNATDSATASANMYIVFIQGK